MPSAINSTNFSSLVSTALFPESNRSGALSLPAEPVERDIQRKVLEPQLTCRHWHIPVLCYRVCSRFEDFQPLKTFQKNISTPKLKRFLRYFSSLVLARFGVVVNSQYPTSGISVFSVSLHLLARFYFSCPKFHHTTRAEYLPHNLWRPICFSIWTTVASVDFVCAPYDPYLPTVWRWKSEWWKVGLPQRLDLNQWYRCASGC